MSRRIVLLQGHPDPDPARFGHALAEAYARGAAAAGHELRRIELGHLEFPVLRRRSDWLHAEPPPALAGAQADLEWAEHMVVFFPLWMGGMPALLKGFLEQVLRPGFAVAPSDGAEMWTPRLQGRSARLVVTMGMPALVYRWYFRAHSLRSLERNILRFCGIRPVRETLIGLVEGSAARRERWLVKLEALGRRGA